MHNVLSFFVAGRKPPSGVPFLKARVYDLPARRDEWVRRIQLIAQNEKARDTYTRYASRNYEPKVRALDAAYPIQTELDFAFYWDLAVHTSGINDKGRKERIDKVLKAQQPATATERRQIIGRVFVETLGNPTQYKSRIDRNALFQGAGGIAQMYGLNDCPFHLAATDSLHLDTLAQGLLRAQRWVASDKKSLPCER